MKKPYLEIGKVVATHGVRGMVKIQPWMDDAEDLLVIKKFYFGKERSILEVENASTYKGMVRMKFQGIDTIDDAAFLRGQILYMDRNDFPLEEGAYFIQDLFGIKVTNIDSGEVYGEIVDVTETALGANKVYHIQTEEGKMLLIPAIPDVVLETDIEGNSMKIRPLEGLFD